MRITIRQRLMLGFGSVVLLLGVVAYAGITSLQDITVRYDDVVHRVDASAMKAREIEAGVQDEARALASYLLTGEAAYAEEFERASAQVAAALDELSGLATGEAHALADELRTGCRPTRLFPQPAEAHALRTGGGQLHPVGAAPPPAAKTSCWLRRR